MSDNVIPFLNLAKLRECKARLLARRTMTCNCGASVFRLFADGEIACEVCGEPMNRRHFDPADIRWPA